LFLSSIQTVMAETMLPFSLSLDQQNTVSLLAVLLFFVLLGIVLSLERIVTRWWREFKERIKSNDTNRIRSIVNDFDRTQMDRAVSIHEKLRKSTKNLTKLCMLAPLFFPEVSRAQTAGGSDAEPLWQQGGIIITVVLVVIPIILGLILMVVKIKKLVNKHTDGWKQKDVHQLAEYLETMSEEERDTLLERKKTLNYSLSNRELSGMGKVNDERGLVSYQELTELPVVPIKKKALPRPHIDIGLSRLIQWYLISATFWLVFGTTVGEYLGIKFLAPDVDDLSWLSFGRLRPVHTNAVFWGWASLGMLGLGYYIVPRVSNVPLARISWGWYSLYLINASVLIGSISLMAGINNGGGEYREYIW